MEPALCEVHVNVNGTVVLNTLKQHTPPEDYRQHRIGFCLAFQKNRLHFMERQRDGVVEEVTAATGTASKDHPNHASRETSQRLKIEQNGSVLLFMCMKLLYTT